MSDPTGIPSLNFVIASLPAAEGMLVAADLPELAVFVAALDATLKLVAAEIQSRAFDPQAAIAAADAAALATLRARFPRG